jgi:hypothetical protein
MPTRTFPNVSNLPEHIIQIRVQDTDPASQVDVYKVPSLLDASYVSIDSLLTDEELTALINPSITAEEQAAIDRQKEAFEQAVDVSGMKSITVQEAKAYINANITDVATATVLKQIVSTLIPIRDEVFPRLPEKE